MRLAIVNAPIPDQSDIKGQANYWKNYFKSDEWKGWFEKFIIGVKEMEDNYGNNCSGLMDLAIVMDGSGSINSNGEDNYKQAKEFVVKLIETFSIESVNIGFVVFSDSARVVFPLNTYLNSSQMQSIIMNSSYPNGWTNTNLGIKSGVEILNNAKNRPGVPKILVLLTDGKPTCTDKALRHALNYAKEHKITIVAVGIGHHIIDSKLLQIAGSAKRVLKISTYKFLSQSYVQINGETCKIPQTPALGSKQTDVLGHNEKRYFKYELPSDGITVKINNHGEKTIAFYSYDNENPSSALNDGQFSGQAFIPNKIPSNYLGKGNAMKRTVFLAIEGLDLKNPFTIETMQGNHLNDPKNFRINYIIIISITSLILVLIIALIIIRKV